MERDTNLIKQYIHTLGIPCVGIAPGTFSIPSYPQDICPLAAGEGDARYQPTTLLPSCQSVIVLLFPYYVKDPRPYNLSLYCRSIDYHTIIHHYLNEVTCFLTQTYPHQDFLSIVDTAPLSDRYLAYLAGLGFIGDNNCFINETYGSFCFIGSILTSLPLKPDHPQQRECFHCGACKRSCLGHCLDTAEYDYHLCKSYLTQKKGELSPMEIQVIQKTPLVFGCDICQDVCPHNHDIPETPIKEFHQSRIAYLKKSDLQKLSNRQFQQLYKNRAFSWRGKGILIRNIQYLEEVQSNSEQRQNPNTKNDPSHK
ncbi:epoxyqueuosine reductase [uncultured Megasphaera sp.]|uniref:epoxyqueuosine reductase n=1 Tax=uncultured Megasphaera sp. TaxID=165188 RepID=UPI002599A934|nr:QueG-associated DUF1730 domain-containing protein [uncultured Megasphaera sp.]